MTRGVRALAGKGLDNEEQWSLLAFSRFLLAIWVLSDHVCYICPDARFHPFDKYGTGAVYCFLAISGFSIHHSISRNREGYWRRRFWRIGPVYFAALTIAAGVTLALPLAAFGALPPVWHWLGSGFLLQALFPVALAALVPAWSLSVEAAYYLMAPLLLRIPSKSLLILLIVSAVFGAWRVHFVGGCLCGDTYFLSAAAMVWSWLAGWIGYERQKPVWFFSLIAATGLAILFVDPLISPGSSWFPNRDMVVAIDASCWCLVLIPICFDLQVRLQAWVSAGFSYLGNLSYPLYLIHWPLLFLLHDRLKSSSISVLQRDVIYVLVPLVAAAGIYHLIDAPLRHGKRKGILWLLLIVLAGSMAATCSRR